jgi:hypothetical protein
MVLQARIAANLAAIMGDDEGILAPEVRATAAVAADNVAGNPQAVLTGLRDRQRQAAASRSS